jgi:hypothetical protein
MLGIRHVCHACGPCVAFPVVLQPKTLKLVPWPHVQQWPTPQGSAAPTLLQAAWASVVVVAQHCTGTPQLAVVQVSTAGQLPAGSASRRMELWCIA